MAFQGVWAVDGSTIAGPLMRLMHGSATRSGEGVVDIGDLAVRELAVPGTSVRVGSGATTVLGREIQWQGSYYSYNTGDIEVPITPTGSGSGRSDLIIARVEDPTFAGSPWTHNASDTLVYARVIEDVDPGETGIPAGETISAIPLARLDIPASTGTITQDMIVDLRQMMDPRSTQVVRIQRGMDPIDYAGDVTDAYENWPNNPWNLAGARVPIPAWATQAQIRATWAQTLLEATGGTGGNNDARGQVRIRFYNGSDELVTTPTAYNVNQTSPTNGYRTTISWADTVSIPSYLRGVDAALAMQVRGTSGFNGRLAFDQYAVGSVEITFNEVPVLDLA
ncbi:hypothetical protein [Allonocardiopsis opalescens]|uniref:Uncharacterized protein n=1 Tax=Allonocardiopsis opalescens TaxID=1144618 RepID=A0A2T0PSX1_9ACTN|nr:hypothetical protein [Allonocardiopsis opalescens]PRX91992.1 hypothetical protein CLV72_11265 [Allonocardiopsis opalescens]